MARKRSFSDYDDAYPTCAKTYATLCIYLPDLSDPNSVSEKLGIIPSKTHVKGENYQGRAMRWPTAWFLETEKQIQSRDVRRHIDWLIEQLTGKEDAIRELQISGSVILVSCFWLSSLGYGGPMLSPKTMKKLGELEIGIEFDVYFGD
jgi:hypothetical protein